MTKLVPIPSPGVSLEYGERGAPLVVIVHDWFGRLPGLEFFADALSQKGYRVLVPDLYNGFATTDEATALRLFDELDVATALDTIESAVSSARAEGSPKVGVIGFSVGGWLALLHAQGGSADAVVAYYASLERRDHGVIPAPVLLHLAEIDEWGEGQEPEHFLDRLKIHGTPVTLFTYLGTRHNFANATIKDRVDARAAALAFARTAVFLDEHLLS